MININGDKMSKSLGNVLWAKDMIEQYGGNEIRWMMLSAHYRAPLNISEETLTNSQKEYERVSNSMKQGYVKLALNRACVEGELLNEYYQPFMDAMADDLNTPNALAAVFDVCKKLNTAIRQREMDQMLVASLLKTMQAMMQVLGIEIPKCCVGEEDCVLYETWRKAVKEKDFQKADVYRAQLMEKGIL